MFIEFIVWIIIAIALYKVADEMGDIIGKWNRIGKAIAIIVAVIVIVETSLYYGIGR